MSTRLWAALLGAAALCACGHSEPFQVSDVDLDVPLVGGEPVRLTYAPGPIEIAWLPDESALIYAGARLVGDRLDRCLSVLRAAGGTVQREICNPSTFDDTIVDTFGAPAVWTDLRLAFFYQNAPGGMTPAFAGLYVAPLADPGSRFLVRSIPFLGPDGNFYTAASAVRWLSTDEIVFLGLADESVVPCPGCDDILVRYGRTIFRASTGTTAAPAVVPGTAFASSVTVGATSDEIYFTLVNDSRIYRRVLSTGATEIAHDFGAAGIARDVHFAPGRLTAIVGGKVDVYADEVGPVQGNDRGGHLYVVETATGTARRISTDTRWFRRPALSPTGARLAAEGYDVTIRPAVAPPGAVDTLIAFSGALWLYGAP